MIQRHEYFNKLLQLKDKHIIKVVTGVRRCGKSTLLMQFKEHLLQSGIEASQIISINFEDIAYENLLSYRKLYDYIRKRLVPDKMNYIFLDEIQNVADFQKAVDSLFIQENIDLYITGSNAYLLSGELATLLSGRYIEIQMLPFSFAEYYELKGGDRRDAWNAYFQQGGFPYAAQIDDEQIRHDYLSGIYNTVLLKEIVARKKLQNVPLLESVTRFLFDNIGNIVSSKKIADSLTSYGRKTTSITVENYIQALIDSFIIYKTDRYDIKGKQILKRLEKYYIVDIGLRNLLLGNKRRDIGHILKNIVYLELIRRGYSVTIGKVGDLEIDFIADSPKGRSYYQVSASILDPSTFDREIAPLKKVQDNYPKYIISMDELPMSEDGIEQINIIDFLMNKSRIF